MIKDFLIVKWMAKWTHEFAGCLPSLVFSYYEVPSCQKAGVLCIIMSVCLSVLPHPPCHGGYEATKERRNTEGCLHQHGLLFGTRGHEKLVVKDHDLCTSRWGKGERLGLSLLGCCTSPLDPLPTPFQNKSFFQQPPKSLFLPLFSILCFITMLCIPTPMYISLEQNTGFLM